jgi:hypothetical protein
METDLSIQLAIVFFNVCGGCCGRSCGLCVCASAVIQIHIAVGGGAKDDSGMIWFGLPAHMVFHVANAWEEEDGTVKVWKQFMMNEDIQLAVVFVDTFGSSCGRSYDLFVCASAVIQTQTAVGGGA